MSVTPEIIEFIGKEEYEIVYHSILPNDIGRCVVTLDVINLDSFTTTTITFIVPDDSQVCSVGCDDTSFRKGGQYFTTIKLNDLIPGNRYKIISKMDCLGLTPTPTRTPTPTHSITPTNTPTVSVSPSYTATPTQTPTLTKTATLTPTPTKTSTITPTQTRSPTPTISVTRTNTPTISLTPTNTPTISITPTQTKTPTPTRTLTPTATQTLTPTKTVTPTASPILSWSLIGSSVSGPFPSVSFGSRISMNSDGDKFIVGIPLASLSGLSEAGSVQFFAINESGTVVQNYASAINGESTSANFGIAVAMNSVGNMIAVSQDNGIIKTYTNVSYGYWSLQSTITVSSSISDIAINNSGNILACYGGTIISNIGSAKVYQFDGSSWNQLGNTIEGSVPNDGFGRAIKLNGSGNRLIIGAPGQTYVRIYEWNGSSWTMLGQQLDKTNFAYGDYSFGESVDIDDSGNTILVRGLGSSPNSGAITRVFNWSGSSWIFKKYFQPEPGFMHMTSTISGDGLTIAIGSTGSSGGRVTTYRLSENQWNQLANIIYNFNSNDFFGSTIALNTAGTRMVIGAPKDPYGSMSSNYGYIQAYKLSGS